MKKHMITLCAFVCTAAMTACVSTSTGNGSSKPVAAEGDDAKPAPYTRDGDYIIYGHYEQDGDESNGPEPIEWEVLEERDGMLLLISRYILETKPYNVENEDVTWETCSLRKWLNVNFYDDAFSEDEQAGIVKMKLSNPDNVCWWTKGGKDTEDHVFLLSAEEILEYFNFNTWDDDSQLGYSQELMAGYTQQALNNGLQTYTVTQDNYDTDLAGYGYDKSCIGQSYGVWWLRSPGYISCRACLVYEYGYAGWGYETLVSFDNRGVRPAIYIKL